MDRATDMGTAALGTSIGSRLARSRFSPDGSMIAIQVGTNVVVVDVETGDTLAELDIDIVDVTTGDVLADNDPRLGDPGSLAWSPDSRRLFFSSTSDRHNVTDLWMYDVEREEIVGRRLPIGGAHLVAGLRSSETRDLFAGDATRFETCDFDDVTCGSLGIHDLAAPLGCDDGVARRGPWGFDETLECRVGGALVALLHTSGSETVLEQGLRALDSRSGGRPGSEPCSPWIVVGETWIAVTDSEDDADRVIAAIGGALQPGGGTGGPPVSYLTFCE
jgi:hypothetical protein